jgi:crossover junction endodeoxyribonuclease RuvC
VEPAKAERAAAVTARDPLEVDELGGSIDLVATPSFRDFRAAPSCVLGVDIGASGAIAMLSRAGDLLAVHDMPTLNDGPARRRAVNPALLAEIVARSHASKAFVEMVGARPGEGAVGAFAFGRSRGVVEGVLGALGVPTTHITPASWKRAVGLPAGRDGAKDAARSAAIARWPAKASLFARVKDDGRAEACLIAIAGLLREARR